jgi:hypothetical protein
MRTKGKEKVTPQKRPVLTSKESFLSALSKMANVSLACEESGVSRQTAYRWRAENEEFSKNWNQALDDGIDMLEGIALKRARESSDTLMIFLLKAHKPQKYRERFEFNLKNDPEFKRTVNAFAEMLQTFVPKEFLPSAITRFAQLTGANFDTERHFGDANGNMGRSQV